MRNCRNNLHSFYSPMFYLRHQNQQHSVSVYDSKNKKKKTSLRRVYTSHRCYAKILSGYVDLNRKKKKFSKIAINFSLNCERTKKNENADLFDCKIGKISNDIEIIANFFLLSKRTIERVKRS